MRLTEFLLKLHACAEGEHWFDSYGYIRNGDFCPLTEVYGVESGNWLPTDRAEIAGVKLGLSHEDSRHIMQSADLDEPLLPNEEAVRLRQMLLWATRIAGP